MKLEPRHLLRSITLTFPDTETKYLLRAYVQKGLLFILLALAIVLSLDVANNFQGVMAANATPSSQEGPAKILYYMLLRAGYVLPSIMPIAALAGTIWTEYTLATTRERLMILNSGRSPMRSAVPAVVFGLLLGILQFLSLGYVRPAAVEGQTVSNFRYYGPKFLRPTTTEPTWVVSHNAIVRARIEIGASVRLKDMLLYSFDESGRLQLMAAASSAVPHPATENWLLLHGSFWRAPAGATEMPANLQPTAFDEITAPLDLQPLWLENIGIRADLLAQADLAALASAGSGVPGAFTYESAYQDRFASILGCLGMALLGATLSQFLFLPRLGAQQLLKAGFAAGGAYVAFTIFPMLGTNGAVTPIVSVWTAPVLVIVGTLLVLLLRSAPLGFRRALQARWLPQE